MAFILSFAQTGLDLRRPTTDLDPGLVRLINLDTRQHHQSCVRTLRQMDPESHVSIINHAYVSEMDPEYYVIMTNHTYAT
jgi:hypothetical protein